MGKMFNFFLFDYYYSKMKKRCWKYLYVLCVALVKVLRGTDFRIVKRDKEAVRGKCLNSEFLSGPYFPAFGLNTQVYQVNIRIQSKCRKIWTRKSPDSDIFRTVKKLKINQNVFKARQRYQLKHLRESRKIA